MGFVLALFLIASSAVLPCCATVQRESHVYGNVVHRDGLAEATWLVWSFYGHNDMPPLVSVVEPPYLDCSNDRGFKIPIPPYCVIGVTTSPWTVAVAYTGQKWSESALAHELLHAHQFHSGIVDSGHSGADWQPGGMLDLANIALARAGY